MPDPAKNLDMKPEEYLQLEETSQVRHEYVDGQLFAMTGATEAHNVICGNLFAHLHLHLHDSGCRAFINDMKVKIETLNSFYYPDILVTCEPFAGQAVYKEQPTIIIEVLSPSTQSIDRREKLMAYRRIASLQQYVLVHQNRYKVEIWSKTAAGRWETSILGRFDQLVLRAPANGQLQIPVDQIYEGVALPPLVNESADEYIWVAEQRSYVLVSEVHS